MPICYPRPIAQTASARVRDEVIRVGDAPGQVLDDVVWARAGREQRLARVRRADGDDLAAGRAACEDA